VNSRDDLIQQVSKLCQDENELKAELLVKNALATHPEDLELMTKLGEIQARLCKDKEAESTFRFVLDRNPHHEDAVCGLGRLLDQALSTEEAEQLYKNFLQNNPLGHRALEDLCRLLLSENRTDEALKLARDQAEQHGNHPNAFDALRYVLHILEDNLESELNDDRENEVIFTQLIDNLLEQLELVVSMERDFSLPIEDLDDDKTRLLSELEHFIRSAPSRKVTVSDELQKRISSYKSWQ
jgi:thioredoxin-like negative regulator of GroEL